MYPSIGSEKRNRANLSWHEHSSACNGRGGAQLATTVKFSYWTPVSDWSTFLFYQVHFA
ncbi:hypothetical protein J6590_099607, partial [Homalodisca vitripennis]